MRNYILLKMINYQPGTEALKDLFKFIEDPTKDEELKNIIDCGFDKNFNELVQMIDEEKHKLKDYKLDKTVGKIETEIMFNIWQEFIKKKNGRGELEHSIAEEFKPLVMTARIFVMFVQI